MAAIARETIRSVVADALEVAREMNLGADYERVLFQELVRAELARGATSGAPGHETPAETGPLQRLAERWKMDGDSLGKLFTFRGDDLLVEVEPQLLDRTKSGATKQLALLVCAARQLGLGESETSSEVIRRLCEEFGSYDSPNFASTLRELAGSLRIGGTGRRRTYQITRPGMDRARDLAYSLTGSGRHA